ncbi:hypothetical protein SIPHO054v2_p0051 [Vibrio phage 103E44.1]|nr:hypothetical protein SIPHO054v2_p0051 [Vibrio phage 103E44.1]QZI87905.1 hypothetical protein SIPHO055v2_p0050 [Vibrio phage 104E43.1]
MNTYDSYAEAKIANPESDIFYAESQGFAPGDKPGAAASWVACEPADHCMTVEKFLAEGHKLVDGDVFLNSENDDVEVGKKYENGIVITEYEANKPTSSVDDKCYILRAAALQPQFQNGDTVYDTDGSTFMYVISHPLLPCTSILLDSFGVLITIRTSKLTKTPPVTPKDGEWWMCELVDGVPVRNVVAVYNGGHWYWDESLEVKHDRNAKHLCHMIRDSE